MRALFKAPDTARPTPRTRRTPSVRKIFVLDTNVLLYDHTCIWNFQEHDIVLPIVVLEELDEFKKGSDLINFQAREFIRNLDELSQGHSLAEGLPLGPDRGRLFVQTGDLHSVKVDAAFTRTKADHRILAVAEQLQAQHAGAQPVIIVSKDINLRMKAKALGIPAEDYETGKIRDIDKLYTGTSLLQGVDKGTITRFYAEPYAIPAAELLGNQQPLPHQYFIVRNGSTSALAHYNPESEQLERVIKRPAYGIDPRNAEQMFAVDALLREDIPLVTLTGKAGTGKTLLALAAALEQKRDYQQIYLARPVVPLGNRDIGYLPGDIKSKLDPYMQPLWDNLSVIRHRFASDSKEQKRIADMLATEKLFIAPLAYIRGRSLADIFFIVDEAQNLTPHEVKTIITRAGEGTKIVFTGDIYQIDSPYLDSQSNGLTFLVDRMKGQPLFAHVNLVKGERSKLAELASDLL
ncbi:MAG TPA: PhoH family protein [Thermoanaerobaculaceae bacterium]|nr:PhoH family protein [Thermoanaerobaculaceae bacterium]HRS16367.1 PhoH family protein [Thermoanaerobaculaceae bacterium]